MRTRWLLWKASWVTSFGTQASWMCWIVTIRRQKFCYLNLPVTLISGQKIWLHDHERYFWAAKLAIKRVNCASSAFFPKIVQKLDRNDEFYAKNYASTIYQLLVPAGIFSRVRKLSAAQMLRCLKPLVTSQANDTEISLCIWFPKNGIETP